MARLNHEDVQKIAGDRTPETREFAAGRVSDAYASGEMSDAERRTAEEIFGMLVQDAEVRVRRAMAETLKSCPFLSREIAVALARDVDEVALPMLEASDVLQDTDLVAIAREGAQAKNIAIAGRAQVSEAVSEALLTSPDTAVTERLLTNENAAIGENTYETILQAHPSAERVAELLASRPDIPLHTCETVVRRLSDRVLQRLVRSRKVSPRLSTALVSAGYEAVYLQQDFRGFQNEQLMDLVGRLDDDGFLTTTFLFKALFVPNMPLFQAGLARKAGLGLDELLKFTRGSGAAAYTTLFDRAKFSANLKPALLVGLESVVAYQNGSVTLPDYHRLVRQRLTDAYKRYSEYPEEVGQTLFALKARSRAQSEDRPGSSHR